MSRASFRMSSDFLSGLLSLRVTPLSTTLPQDIRIVEVSDIGDGIFSVVVESDEVFALDNEIPEIEAWYWGGDTTRKGL